MFQVCRQGLQSTDWPVVRLNYAIDRPSAQNRTQYNIRNASFRTLYLFFRLICCSALGIHRRSPRSVVSPVAYAPLRVPRLVQSMLFCKVHPCICHRYINHTHPESINEPPMKAVPGEAFAGFIAMLQGPPGLTIRVASGHGDQHVDGLKHIDGHHWPIVVHSAPVLAGPMGTISEAMAVPVRQFCAYLIGFGSSSGGGCPSMIPIATPFGFWHQVLRR